MLTKWFCFWHLLNTDLNLPVEQLLLSHTHMNESQDRSDKKPHVKLYLYIDFIFDNLTFEELYSIVCLLLCYWSNQKLLKVTSGFFI